MNIGTNRWSFKPEVGISKTAGPWTLEVSAAAMFFTVNDEFFGGNRRVQDPLYSAQAHASYGFGPRSPARGHAAGGDAVGRGADPAGGSQPTTP